MFTRWSFLVLVALVLVGSTAPAKEAIRWAADVPRARQQAAQTGRLVLLHFWAPWCGPCRRLEKTVFVRPSVAKALESHFVAVKVNVDQQPALAKKYGVRQIPCDVIITPSGQLVGKTISPAAPQAYTSKLVSIARRAVPPGQATLVAQGRAAAEPPSAPRGVAVGPSVPAASRPMAFPTAAAQAPVASAPRYAQAAKPPTASAPAGPVLPGSGPAGTQTSPGPRLPWPLALDGYCVVTLVEQGRWVRGNPQFGIRHRGQLYLFAGPQQKDRFWQNPEGYAPVLSGYDVVVYLEQGHLVPGKRRHGVFYQGRIYLFSNEHTLRKFEMQPERYAPEVLRRVAMMDQWSRLRR